MPQISVAHMTHGHLIPSLNTFAQSPRTSDFYIVRMCAYSQNFHSMHSNLKLIVSQPLSEINVKEYTKRVK